MSRYFRTACALVLAILLPALASAQAKTDAEKEASQRAWADRLGTLLTASGPKTGIELTFKRSDKNPANFVAMKTAGLKNAEQFEVVVGATKDDTIGFRIYPKFMGGYVNIDKVRNSLGLLRKMATFSYTNFIFWGADDTGDIFAGYTFTMESGFPDKAIEIVLYSIKPLDGYFGEMRPFIDGSSAVK